MTIIAMPAKAAITRVLGEKLKRFLFLVCDMAK